MIPRPTHALPALLLASLGVLWLPAPLRAAPVCDAPAGRGALRLESTPSGARQVCGLQGLKKLPSREIVTALPSALGMPGEYRWKGVPLRYLVEQLGGGERSRIQLTALNDYAIQIPWADLVRYDPILAYSRDGQPMGIREKGPLILIYPFAGNPQLENQEYLNRTIWQVNAIFVR